MLSNIELERATPCTPAMISQAMVCRHKHDELLSMPAEMCVDEPTIPRATCSYSSQVIHVAGTELGTAHSLLTADDVAETAQSHLQEN